MDNNIKGSKRNQNLEECTRRSVAETRNELEWYINRQFRRNIEGTTTKEQEILIEVFGHLIQKYWKIRYYRPYDDEFRENFDPYLVYAEGDKRDPGAIREKEKRLTYTEVEEMARNNSVLFYLHFSKRENKRDELLCFESPKLLLGYSSVRDYVCDSIYEHPATNDGTKSSGVWISYSSTMLQQQYIGLAEKVV